MDIVIPYVNGNDPFWQEQHAKYENVATDWANSEARYRDYGTLKYVFRSIETYVPWIDKIFLIVSSPSQVPEWLDTSNPRLRIIYHEDYIPSEFLPTFNANTIECFLWRIPELSEYFIYGNDDFFFLRPMKKEDFFVENKVRVNIYKHTNKIDTPFKKMCQNNVRFGTLSDKKLPLYVYTDHTFSPKRKSRMEKLFNIWGEEIYNTFTPIRDEKNITQYVFDIFAWHSKLAATSNIKSKFRPSLKDDFFSLPEEYDTVCFNDLEGSDFERMQKKILQFMTLYYPLKCSFEKKTPEDKLVSVIIPAYNGADRIRKTLDSIKTQTYKNFECLVIDDGGSDNTKEIVDTYDERFKYFYKENGGVASARVFGVEHAKGDYICFSDDDDINLPKRLESCVEYLNTTGEDIVCTMMVKSRKVSNNCYFNCRRYHISQCGYRGKPYLSHFCNMNSIMTKLDFIKKFQFPKAHVSEDAMLMADMIIHLNEIPVLNYLGYNHINRVGSVLNTMVKMPLWKQEETLNAFQDFIRRHKNDSPEQVAFVKRHLINIYPWMEKVLQNKEKFKTILSNINRL